MNNTIKIKSSTINIHTIVNSLKSVNKFLLVEGIPDIIPEEQKLNYINFRYAHYVSEHLIGIQYEFNNVYFEYVQETLKVVFNINLSYNTIKKMFIITKELNV